MLSHEGVSEGRRGTRASAQVMRAGKGRMIRMGVRMIQVLVRMIRLRRVDSASFGCRGCRITWMIREGIRMIQLSPDDPEGGPDVRADASSCSIFFLFLPSSLPCLALVL